MLWVWAARLPPEKRKTDFIVLLGGGDLDCSLRGGEGTEYPSPEEENREMSESYVAAGSREVP